MIFAGKELSEQDIRDCYKAVFSQFAGQVVACDVLMHCGYWDEIRPADMAEALYAHNFVNWFLKRLGIIREDNLINMVRHFMGQDVPEKLREKQETGEKHEL